MKTARGTYQDGDDRDAQSNIHKDINFKGAEQKLELWLVYYSVAKAIYSKSESYCCYVWTKFSSNDKIDLSYYCQVCNGPCFYDHSPSLESQPGQPGDVLYL